MSGINYLSPFNTGFENRYIALRKMEGRLYTLEEVRKLPDISSSHPHKKEWNIRKDSAEKLVKYLAQKKDIETVLEIGCGNGWFSNYLALFTGAKHVHGLDVNKTELELAAGAFTSEKLAWLYADIFHAILPLQHYDLVVLNSSVHYFPDLRALFARLFELLQPSGEIHVLDSPFYASQEELEAARKRTEEYFSKLGHPQLAPGYTPHLYSEMEQLGFVPLYKPGKNTLIRKITGALKRPFPWFVYGNSSSS